MTTQSFLALLANNPQKELVFEYEANQFIPVYHITEVKNVHFESIDCGGNAHEEYQTITQLWISPKDFLLKKCMTAEKALKIFNIVDGVKPMKKETEIFFEYGYQDLRTSVFSIEAITHKKNEESDNQLIIKMFVPKTACKPSQQVIEKGKAALNCCAPVEQVAEKNKQVLGCC